MERIDKIIASQGQYSRKEVKDLIAKRRIAVDGRIVSSSSEKADPMTMLLTVDGKPLEFKRNLYLVLNKPKGYVSATEDREHPTVLELVPQEYRRRDLFPAGRLDRDTTGLMIITECWHIIFWHRKNMYRSVIMSSLTFRSRRKCGLVSQKA